VAGLSGLATARAVESFDQRSQQSFSEHGPATDQARAHRPLDTTFTSARLTPRAWRQRAESELPEGDEKPPSQIPRSLDPQLLREPPPASRGLGRLAAVAGLIIAASVGAAIALFASIDTHQVQSMRRSSFRQERCAHITETERRRYAYGLRVR
jgi:hypothetical protein